MKVLAVIPARYMSSRFPGKPLAKILEKPMIQWVYEAVNSCSVISETIVATDDQRIYDTVLSFGGNVEMTGNCSCGTDRVYEVAKTKDFDIILNVQGDEPLISNEALSSLVSAFDEESVSVATLINELIDETDCNDPNVVKVVLDNKSNAIYFSRLPIPFCRDGGPVKRYRHVGVYGYRFDFLKKYVSLPASNLEKIESLEQLRILENGFKIKTIISDYEGIGVDIPEHIKLIENRLRLM